MSKPFEFPRDAEGSDMVDLVVMQGCVAFSTEPPPGITVFPVRVAIRNIEVTTGGHSEPSVAIFVPEMPFRQCIPPTPLASPEFSGKCSIISNLPTRAYTRAGIRSVVLSDKSKKSAKSAAPRVDVLAQNGM